MRIVMLEPLGSTEDQVMSLATPDGTGARF
jgi:hypothetical protein